MLMFALVVEIWQGGRLIPLTNLGCGDVSHQRDPFLARVEYQLDEDDAYSP